MKNLNGYYIISIVTLVLMSLIFARVIMVPPVETRAQSLAQQVLDEYPGTFTGSLNDSPETFILALKDSAQTGNWITITRDKHPFIQAKVSDFEDEQILVELFVLDSMSYFERWEGCELLLGIGMVAEFEGGTLGDLCDFSTPAQTFRKLKIFLANPQVLIDIETWSSETDSLLGQAQYRFVKETSL